MDNHRRFNLHRLAWFKLRSFSDKERETISSSIERLVDLPADQWETTGAKQFAWDEPLFLVRVGRGWRAIVRANPEGPPEVLDIVHKDTLKTFASDRT